MVHPVKILIFIKRVQGLGGSNPQSDIRNIIRRYLAVVSFPGDQPVLRHVIRRIPVPHSASAPFGASNSAVHAELSGVALATCQGGVMNEARSLKAGNSSVIPSKEGLSQ